WWGLGLGVGIGALCMVRPAFQLIVPALGLAWVLGRRGGRQRGAAGVAILGGFLGVGGAGVGLQGGGGVRGSGSGGAHGGWGARVGVCEAGLLADDFPLPEKVRLEFERSVKPAPDVDEKALQFVVWMDAWKSEEGRSLLKQWVLHSVRSAPGAYAAMVVRA